MPGLLKDIDPDGLLEYSVVYTDRALNHMSRAFCDVMTDISKTLKKVYKADTVIVVPGSGTFAMEAVARQFAEDKKCFVIQNGWFSYRWSQILEKGRLPQSLEVMKAAPSHKGKDAPFSPPNIEDVVAKIQAEKPDFVFAPHVETSSGMVLADDYLKKLSQACHDNGGLFVLDCIASGALWVDMRECGVDILISAPQKGWSGSPCCGLVMMNKKATDLLATTESSSFACDLAKWHDIMAAYEAGKHAYHATMPTDSLRRFRDVMKETEAYGFDSIKENQMELGEKIRQLLSQKGFESVAAEGAKASSVVVSYTDDKDIKSGKKFEEYGMQVAAGVPLQCGEPEDFQTFRVGLFGLDKLKDVAQAVTRFSAVLDKIK